MHHQLHSSSGRCAGERELEPRSRKYRLRTDGTATFVALTLYVAHLYTSIGCHNQQEQDEPQNARLFTLACPAYLPQNSKTPASVQTKREPRVYTKLTNLHDDWRVNLNNIQSPYPNIVGNIPLRPSLSISATHSVAYLPSSPHIPRISSMI